MSDENEPADSEAGSIPSCPPAETDRVRDIYWQLTVEVAEARGEARDAFQHALNIVAPHFAALRPGAVALSPPTQVLGHPAGPIQNQDTSELARAVELVRGVANLTRHHEFDSSPHATLARIETLVRAFLSDYDRRTAGKEGSRGE